MPSQAENEQLKILLVDDDIDFAASMSGILDLEGYQVEVAHSVKDAVAMAETLVPDIALVDIRIGQESGLDLVASLHTTMPELICVMVTAYADTDTAIEALKSGVYDYLRKPFETSELFAVLHRCADRLELQAEKLAAEKARAESEARFQVAFETSPDAIVLAYPGGGVIDVNPGFEQMTGYRRDQVIGKNSEEIGLWKNSADRIKLLELLEKYGHANNLEVEFRLYDGQIRAGLISARVVQIAGEQIGLFVVRDIHELKLKEKAIMESEARYRGVVSNIPGAVYRCLIDADWTMLYISGQIKEICGYAATDFVQNKVRSFASIIHPDDQQMVAQVVADSVKQKLPFKVEYRVINVDGDVRWVWEMGRSVLLGGDPAECLDGVIFDITENKEIEQRLIESQNRFNDIHEEYNTVLEGITDAIILIDREYRIVWANPGAIKDFSAADKSLEGLGCEQPWGKSGDQSLEGVKWVFETGTPVESMLKTDDGRSWGVKTFPVKNEAGQVASVVQIASDLTEKIRLRNHASRSAHLAALGELAAGVAHEINNPTGMILLDMEMIKDTLKDLVPLLEKHCPDLQNEKVGGLSFQRFKQEIPLVVDEVHQGAFRIKRIVEELKDFSKPTVGELATIDLNDVAQKAVRQVRPTIKKATKHFSENYSQIPLLFAGDALRMEQVLVNLLLNACHALPDHSRNIEVETVLLAEINRIRVMIRDEGVGIAPEILPLITDPFYTTRRDSGGTGLGLSVSSRIVDEHGGTMNFDSEPDRGTTVTIELPSVGRVNLND